ncbi:MAG: hypothetical protein K0S49_2093, partial [Microbacterium sp.]|nr:hypothetical protein [Microbacterium sp.]
MVRGHRFAWQEVPGPGVRGGVICQLEPRPADGPASPVQLRPRLNVDAGAGAVRSQAVAGWSTARTEVVRARAVTITVTTSEIAVHT